LRDIFVLDDLDIRGHRADYQTNQGPAEVKKYILNFLNPKTD